MDFTVDNVLYMLMESNLIEDVHDQQSLIDSWKAFDYLLSQRTLTIETVLSAHKILMDNQPILQKYKGDLRDAPVTIGGETKKLPKIVIRSLLEDLLTDINLNRQFEDAILHHIQFESIHPFIDGNGRLGRILMNWELHHCGAKLMVYKNSEKFDVYYKLFGGSHA